jgi:5-methylcytosine-specific restriction endonuclease McrBC regulatory subunit McrC
MTKPIKTTDNNCGKCKAVAAESKEHSALNRLANERIDSLCDKFPNLWLFPRGQKSEDLLEEQHIFDLTAEGKLTTGNVMGIVESDGVIVQISSRFAQNDENDWFLHYMLQKVLHINLFDFSLKSSNNSFYDFLLYLFPDMLMAALKQGVYKEYRRHEYNDANVKGPIDISRHIKQNNPFQGKIAYNTREQTLDNPITQLIRHTIEYIKTHSYGSSVIKGNRFFTDEVKKIVSATPSYNRLARQKIINLNLRPLSHSYFTKYRPLQRLCIQILTKKKMSFGDDKDNVKGILFDGAWLWEEYVNILIGQKFGGMFLHPENKTGKHTQHLFQNRGEASVYPDFIKFDTNTESIKENIVADAKYKPMGNINGSDYSQVISYMAAFHAATGYFLYPEQDNDKEQESPKKLRWNRDMSVTKLGLKIPQHADDWEQFFTEIQQNEAFFLMAFSDQIKLNFDFNDNFG